MSTPGREEVDARPGVAEGVVALGVPEMCGVELGHQVAARHADGLPDIGCRHIATPLGVACCSATDAGSLAMAVPAARAPSVHALHQPGDKCFTH